MSGVSSVNNSKYLYYDKDKKKVCIKPDAPKWAKDEYDEYERCRSLEYKKSITVE